MQKGETTRGKQHAVAKDKKRKKRKLTREVTIGSTYLAVGTTTVLAAAEAAAVPGATTTPGTDEGADTAHEKKSSSSADALLVC